MVGRKYSIFAPFTFYSFCHFHHTNQKIRCLSIQAYLCDHTKIFSSRPVYFEKPVKQGQSLCSIIVNIIHLIFDNKTFNLYFRTKVYKICIVLIDKLIWIINEISA